MPALLTIDEVVHLLRISRSTIYKRRQAGDFPAPVRVSPRRILWQADELEAWLQRQVEKDASVA